MKKTLRLFALILTLVMVLCVCLPVLATETTAAQQEVKLTIRAVREGLTKRINKKDFTFKAVPGTVVAYSAPAIKGYTFSKVTDAAGAEVNMAAYTVPAADTLLYANYLKHQKLTVQYVYGSKNKSAAKKTTMTLCPGAPYTIEPKTIKGYTYIQTEDANKGVMPNSAATVYVRYGKDIKVTVKFVLDNKKKTKLAEPAVITGFSGDAYDVAAVTPTLGGYTVSSVSDKNKGVFGTKNHTVTVTYTAAPTVPAPVTTPASSADTVSFTTTVVYLTGGVKEVLASSKRRVPKGVETTLQRPIVEGGWTLTTLTINDTYMPLESTTYTPRTDTEVIWYIHPIATYSTPTPTPKPGSENIVGYPTVATSAEASYMLSCINNERTAAGRAPLVIDERLNWCAAVRAEESYIVSDAFYYSHTRPNGSKFYTLSDLIRGENLGAAVGTPTATADVLMKDWMGSISHKDNILYSGFKTIGLGYYVASDGAVYWAQIFGA